MADEQIHDLEHLAARSAVGAEARLLLERVRGGDLCAEDLRLAAYLGAEAARVALGDEAPAPCSRDRLQAEFPPQVHVRLALAAVQQEVAASWDSLPDCRKLLDRLCQRVESWLMDELEEDADQACMIGHEISQWMHAAPARALPQALSDMGKRLGDVAYFAGSRVEERDGQVLSDDPAWVASQVTERCLEVLEWLVTDEQEGRWHEAIAAEIVPWALGTNDPVRERVEARRREADGESPTTPSK